LGPIPLAHAALDFAALFPGDQVAFAAAEPAEGTMPASPPSIIVRRPGLARGTNDDIVAIASLHGERITRLEVFAPGIPSPIGVEVGATAATIARALPDATCEWGGSARGMLCSSEHAPAFTFQFETGNWGDAIADAPADATVAAVIWDAPDGAELTLARRPAAPAPAPATAGHPDALGSIDLRAAKLDLRAVVPGAEIEYEAGGPVPDDPTDSIPPQLTVSLPGSPGTPRETLLVVTLKGTRVIEIQSLAPGFPAPSGIDVGTTAAEVARRIPDATCVPTLALDYDANQCRSPRDPAFSYIIATDHAVATIGAVPPDALIDAIVWDAPKRSRLAVGREALK
ncbi:MAG: hypothetical protein K8W52_05610, partial [Deltaproteobacteria bacterium]|nr:hypothetical protein [Deltaproteobacteria bacterium]